ncbi:hypothetical protein APSETT445_007581 [Aspergillus pseudonomiae]
MDQIERRCASLTALLHRLNPDVNIEDALETTTILPSGLQASAFDGVSPASVDEFEWSEASLGSPAQLRRVGLDGMASLPTGSTEAGYLGNSAGSSILRNVPGLIPESSDLETNQRTQVLPKDSNQGPDLLPSAHLGTSAILDGLARLASIGNNIYSNVISAPKENILDLRISRSLDHRLKAWRLSLPVYFTAQDVPDWFRGPRAVVGWKEQNLRMMLWWGSQRLCSLLSDVEEARNMCHYVAIETIQDITTFCLDYRDNIHVGLSWYATYFLFQATVVLSIHYLRPHQPLDMSPDSVNQELWALSISRARDCLAQLSQDNEAATRCLAVLERIRDQSERSQQSSMTPSGTRPDANVHADHAQLQPVLATDDTNPTSFAIDPALQILFQDTAWNDDIFEGLHGFPITDEVETFDYMPPNA